MNCNSKGADVIEDNIVISLSKLIQCCPLSHPLLYCYSSSNISLLSGITMLSSITSVLLLLQFTQHQFAQWYYNVVLYHIRSLTVTVRPTSVCSVILQCCPLSHPRLYCYSSPNISLLSDITMLSKDNIVISLSKLMLDEL
jgi:hypothetical protein